MYYISPGLLAMSGDSFGDGLGVLSLVASCAFLPFAATSLRVCECVGRSLFCFVLLSFISFFAETWYVYE